MEGTHPADAVHADVPCTGLTGCPIHHGLPVLVVEVLPLGDAGQLTLVPGWGRQKGKAEIPVRFKGYPSLRGVWAGPKAHKRGEGIERKPLQQPPPSGFEPHPHPRERDVSHKTAASSLMLKSKGNPRIRNKLDT